jgi:AraC-like DNA-binding protein
MEYLNARPSVPELRASIGTYIQINRRGAVSKTLPPGTGAALLLNVQGSYQLDGMPAPDTVIIGIRETPLQLDCDPSPTDRMFVQFTACGLSRFISTPADRFAKKIISAEEIFSKEALRLLVMDLSSAKTFGERTSILDRFFLKLYSGPRYLEEAVGRLTHQLCEHSGTSLGSLFRDIPASVRHTERLFSRLVGIDPQTFARLARFDRAKNGILARGGQSLTDVGIESGYYDQAHFIREFRRLTHGTPGSYRSCLAAPRQRAVSRS